jgi:MFS transporter, FSR family, fosmidomycin resistance protein
VPLLAGGALELPLGILASAGAGRRRLAVLGGGVLFVLSLLAVGGARSFAVLLCAFTAFYPASGAFVSLTQATLMDASPDRQAQVMARWDLAGSAGAVAGPLLLTAVLAAGGGWRAAYLILAGLAGLAWLGTCLRDPHPAAPAASSAERHRASYWARELASALRNRCTMRWLALLMAGDLLVDGLTGFLALYLVDVVHLRPAVAALAIAVRLGSALAGDAALVFVLERAAARDATALVLRASAVAAALAYPGFLLAPGLAAKLAILVVLSAATAPWYPLLQARLYGSLPDRSSVAVTLGSAAGMAGAFGPLAVGMAAQWFGLPRALAVLTVVPVVILAGSAARRE